MEEEFGLKVQWLAQTTATLQRRTTLKLHSKKMRRSLPARNMAARQAEASDDGDDEVKDENSVQYSIDYKDAEYASTIQWLSKIIRLPI